MTPLIISTYATKTWLTNLDGNQCSHVLAELDAPPLGKVVRPGASDAETSGDHERIGRRAEPRRIPTIYDFLRRPKEFVLTSYQMKESYAQDFRCFIQLAKNYKWGPEPRP